MNPGTWALVGLALLGVGLLVTFVAAYRGVGLERHPSAVLNPAWNAKATRRAIIAARVGLYVATFALGVLIASGVAALFAALSG